MSRQRHRSGGLAEMSGLGVLAVLMVAVFVSAGRRSDARAQNSPQTQAPPATTAAASKLPAYQDLRRITPMSGNAQQGEGKAATCAPCHGPQGISTVPIFPNLAGQRADYMYWELMGFKRGTRPESPMTALVTALDDQAMRDLAAYYAGLVPVAASPAGEADAEQLRRGERLYLAGDPAAGIPACVGCHGGDARGHPDALRADSDGHTPYAVYPALRGQQAPYLETRLGQYRAGTLRDSTTDLVMSGIGERLNDDSIKAVSAWLSSLAR